MSFKYNEQHMHALTSYCFVFALFHAHQVHLSLLQLNLLLPQFLTMQQLHTEILTQSGWRILDEHVLNE